MLNAMPMQRSRVILLVGDLQMLREACLCHPRLAAISIFSELSIEIPPHGPAAAVQV